MSYDTPPRNLAALNQRLKNLEVDASLTLRRRTTMALVVIGQMLPEGAVKGGSAMALRYGSDTRFTRDLDAARSGGLSSFRADFEERLAQGWARFTGRLAERKAPKPKGIPAPYVMKPFDVKLDYEGKPWCTVPFELGHNEIGDADDPDFTLAPSIVEMFTSVGLPAPSPVAVMPADHQIAQKIHASTASGSDRARDLIDLQLLGSREQLNLAAVRATCVRLFDYRKAHIWPPIVTEGAGWATLYAEAAEGLDVVPDVAPAIEWLNKFIADVDQAAPNDQQSLSEVG
ncbi:nucleotidyl transferase AbiEii/AbiGii toxin family protein [Paenarthrobacter sp. CM16]|uniref:nucleotidyl transferase AbiEii/AbiGii toxin family protein n=1 Tax=Paenarthrobacter sp. CM16 TaxID=2738447 RepID=UPI0015545A44|nr:nucleotidyl transferase AbiEii/AbiGii toxin family protein [Paenarthrobacter sp. CM16]NQD87941.1 nucleotidyl transferase AbiEii/AbiGii toxin family protein [Paenarthrobacter sp. CM16]